MENLHWDAADWKSSRGFDAISGAGADGFACPEFPVIAVRCPDAAAGSLGVTES